MIQPARQILAMVASGSDQPNSSCDALAMTAKALGIGDDLAGEERLFEIGQRHVGVGRLGFP